MLHQPNADELMAMLENKSMVVSELLRDYDKIKSSANAPVEVRLANLEEAYIRLFYMALPHLSSTDYNRELANLIAKMDPQLAARAQTVLNSQLYAGRG